MTKEFNPTLTHIQAKTIMGMVGMSQGLYAPNRAVFDMVDEALSQYMFALVHGGGDEIRERCERVFSVSPSDHRKAGRSAAGEIFKAVKAEQP